MAMEMAEAAGERATYEVSELRSFRSTPARTWQLVASEAGARAWLGDAPEGWWHGTLSGPAPGDVLTTVAGERYEVVAAEVGEQLVLRTLGPLLPTTLVELAITGERGRSVVLLRQDGLVDEAMREPTQLHWQRALDRIGELLDEE